MDSPFDRPPREMASLGFNGVCVHRELILADPTMGSVRSRFRLDRLVFSADVSGLLVRRQTNRTRYRTRAGRHLEVLCSISSGRLYDASDFQSCAVFWNNDGR